MCPEQTCLKDLSVKFMTKHLMNPDLYEKFIKFSDRIEIHRNPNLKFCPTTDCEGFLRKGPASSKNVTCDQCKKEICFACLSPAHEGESCESKMDKDYLEWATPNAENVGQCKNCFVKIEKEGGCPHMICQVCHHEWCWVCKEDFPVHLQHCPNYQMYLDLLEFQGLNHNEWRHSTRWFFESGVKPRGFFFWLLTSLLLLLLAMPIAIAVNVLITPCLMLMVITARCPNSSTVLRRCYMIPILILILLILYSLCPIVFLIVTCPQIFIYIALKCTELKNLCKNRCRSYRSLSARPILRRYFDRIGIRL